MIRFIQRRRLCSKFSRLDWRARRPQRGRRFKEAFAPELVEHAVAEMNRTVRHIVDPFGGSGTTGLAAQFLGIRPTVIEVNPYLADLIEAKLARYDTNAVRDSYSWLMDQVSKTKTIDPRTFLAPRRRLSSLALVAERLWWARSPRCSSFLQRKNRSFYGRGWVCSGSPSFGAATCGEL